MVNLYFIEKLSLNVSTRIIDESLGSSTHYGKDSNIGSQFKIKNALLNAFELHLHSTNNREQPVHLLEMGMHAGSSSHRT